jgi:hypothetical protein
MHGVEELLTPFINPIREPNPVTSYHYHQTINMLWEVVAMHTVEQIPAPDFALETSYSHDSPRGPLGFANVRQLVHPFPRRDYSSSPSTTRSNYTENSSLDLVSSTRK